MVFVTNAMAQDSKFIGTWTAHETEKVWSVDKKLETEHWKLILNINKTNDKYRVKIKQKAIYEYYNRPDVIIGLIALLPIQMIPLYNSIH